MTLVQVFLRVWVGRPLMDPLKTVLKKKFLWRDLEGRKCSENLENVSGNCGYRSGMQFMLLEDFFDDGFLLRVILSI